MDLQAITAAILLLSMTVYLLTGVADFGAGFWELVAKGEKAKSERELISKTLAPIWEANHVWLIVAIVIISGAFPKLMPFLSIKLHIPLLCMLIGITLRGAAFTFRHYGPQKDPSFQTRWSTIFSVSSAITPFFLGVSLGAVVKDNTLETNLNPFFSAWWNPFSVSVGIFTIIISIFLAAIYLAAETSEKSLSQRYCKRAFASGVLLAINAVVLLLLSRSYAPTIYESLTTHPLAMRFHFATATSALATFYFLLKLRARPAQVSAAIQVTLIMLGLGLAQYPYLITPIFTIYNASAPDETLQVLLQVFLLGFFLLAPAFGYLFWIFSLKKKFSAYKFFH